MIPIRDRANLHKSNPAAELHPGECRPLPAGTYTTQTFLPLTIVEGPYIRVVEDVRAGTDRMVGGWSPTRKQSTPTLWEEVPDQAR